MNINLKLSIVRLFPTLGYNLVSVVRSADKGIHSLVYGKEWCFEHKDWFVVSRGNSDHRSCFYRLPNPINHIDISTVLVATEGCTVSLWKRSLAHMDEHDMQKFHVHVNGVAMINGIERVCRTCRDGECQKLSFQSNVERANQVGEVVHSALLVRGQNHFATDCSIHPDLRMITHDMPSIGAWCTDLRFANFSWE